MPLAGYIRVSTDEQAKDGFSIEAQKRILEAYAVVKGLGSVDLFVDDGYSAKNLRRPAMQRLLKACENGQYDMLIVWRLDRLSRSLRDTLMILEDILQPRGIEIISTSEAIDTSTPSGRLMLNVLASFAQNEREVISERTTDVLIDLAQKCRHLGGVPPFGYKVVDGYYELDEVKAPAVREVFRMFVEREGYSAMLDYLNGQGFTTARGNDFAKNSLYDLLRNEKYVGVYTYNRSVAATRDGKRNHHKSKPVDKVIRVPGGMPAIIDQHTWRRAVALRDENKDRAGAYNAKTVYTLSGIAVCGVCGGKMFGNIGGRDRNGTNQRHYNCRNKCVTRLRKEKAEKYVMEVLKEYLKNERIIRDAANIANNFTDAERRNPARTLPNWRPDLRKSTTAYPRLWILWAGLERMRQHRFCRKLANWIPKKYWSRRKLRT